MPFNDDYLLQIRVVTSILYAENGNINIVVKRPYAYLVHNLENVFQGQGDVRVTVDRRFSERRKLENESVQNRRTQERRQIKETLVDVVISD